MKINFENILKFNCFKKNPNNKNMIKKFSGLKKTQINFDKKYISDLVILDNLK